MDSGPLVPANSGVVREIPLTSPEFGRAAVPQVYPVLPSQESAAGEYIRVLAKRKWVIFSCVAAIFAVVAIASLKMTPIY